MPIAFTPPQKDALIAAWAGAKRHYPSVAGLGSRFDVRRFVAAVAAVDAAIPGFRAGQVSDDRFVTLLDTVFFEAGSIEDRSGNLVIDSGGPDATVIDKFGQAMPNYKSIMVVTGREVQSRTKKDGSGVGMLLFGAAALLGLVVLIRRSRQ